MFKKWTCVSLMKGPGIIPDDVQTALQIGACSLVMEKIGARHISPEVCNAYIETEGNTVSYGGVRGVLFKAQVNSDGGDYAVNFLMSQSDLESGAAQLRESLEEGGYAYTPGRLEFPKELTDFLPIAGTARLQ